MLNPFSLQSEGDKKNNQHFTCHELGIKENPDRQMVKVIVIK